MASEATNMAVRGNMHMNIRVFEVSDFNFVVKNDIRHQLRLGPQAPLRNGTEKPDSNRYLDFVKIIHSLLGPSNTKPTVICGDFNFDYYKDPNNSLRVMLEKRGFTQIVTTPTTIRGNCIDHVYVRGLDHTHHLHYPYYSDHEAVCVIAKKKSTK